MVNLPLFYCLKLEIYNPLVLYMSGRSGYGRSKIVGKLINLPANMMMAGLAPTVAREVGAEVILRGLRAGFDFEQEFEMALMWRNLAPDIDVVCMMSALEHQFIYSSRIKEVARLGANIDNLVPPHIAEALKERI